jgi:hypothetical protein
MAEQGSGTGKKHTGSRRERKEQFSKLSQGTTQIIQQAAQLLDEEMAAGIVAAKAAQQRFGKEGKFSGDDFKELLSKFRADSHEMIGMLGDQLAQLRSGENQPIIDRFLGHTHDLLDLTLDTMQVGAEFANQSLGGKLKKKATGAPRAA